MIFDLKGQIVAVVNERSGESAKGPWKSADVIVEEVYGNYVNKVSVGLFNEQVDQAKAMIGTRLTVVCTLGAREYNGRYYNDCRLREFKDVPNAQTAAPAPGPQRPPLYAQAESLEPQADDLPW